jgi:hypothetical protein
MLYCYCTALAAQIKFWWEFVDLCILFPSYFSLCVTSFSKTVFLFPVGMQSAAIPSSIFHLFHSKNLTNFRHSCLNKITYLFLGSNLYFCILGVDNIVNVCITKTPQILTLHTIRVTHLYPQTSWWVLYSVGYCSVNVVRTWPFQFVRNPDLVIAGWTNLELVYHGKERLFPDWVLVLMDTSHSKYRPPPISLFW